LEASNSSIRFGKSVPKEKLMPSWINEMIREESTTIQPQPPSGIFGLLESSGLGWFFSGMVNVECSLTPFSSNGMTVSLAIVVQFNSPRMWSRAASNA
jgi:hypothetical protein